MNIIVFGAHTDDEHGMSGTIRLMANDGHSVHLVITTDGQNNKEERQAEMEAAAKILGIESVTYLGEPDGKLFHTSEIQDRFNVLVDSLPKPDVVFVMWPVDVHPDHTNTATLVMRRYYQRGVNTPMFAYALNSSGRAYTFVRPQTTAFFPTHYVDVGEVLEDMMIADACHVSQDAPNMWKGVEANLRGRATEATLLSQLLNRDAVVHAEAFVYMTRFGAPPNWMSKYFLASTWLPRGIPFEVTPESVGLV